MLMSDGCLKILYNFILTEANNLKNVIIWVNFSLVVSTIFSIHERMRECIVGKFSNIQDKFEFEL